jgi:cell division septal protein FtsQ
MLKRRKKFNYSGKKYSNPFFRKKRKRVILPVLPRKFFRFQWNWRLKLITSAVLIIFAGSIWFFYFSSYFNIITIEVAGNKKIAADDIKNLAWRQAKENRLLILKQENLNAFNKNKLRETLNEHYYLENLSINKKLPGTIIITIKEKEYSAVWYESDKYYYIDSNGNIFSEADPLQIKQQNYPLIENRKGARVEGRIVKVEDGDISYIILLFKEFKNNYKNFKIDRFILDSDINTVKMKILDGPEIYFNTKEDVNGQITKLMIIVNEKLKDDFINKEYIDLRYGDKVYIDRHNSNLYPAKAGQMLQMNYLNNNL